MKKKIKSKKIANPIKQRQLKIKKKRNAFINKLLAVLAILVALLALYLSMNKILFYIYQLTGDLGFKVKTISINGQKHVEEEQIRKILNIKKDSPIFAVSLDNLEKKLENIEWIKSITIRRLLPDSINITLVERIPVALGQKDKKLYIIDDEGKIINESNLKPYIHLPIFIGDGAEIYANSLIKMFKTNPELFKHITSVIRVSERRWNIRFDNSLEVKMPEDNIQEAWKILIRFHKKNELLKPELATIDLRIPQKIFIEKR